MVAYITAQGDNLGVGCWIVIAQVAVLALAHDLPILQDDRAYGDLAGCHGRSSLRQRELHPCTVILGRSGDSWFRGFRHADEKRERPIEFYSS
jgi:hypothetical protein